MARDNNIELDLEAIAKYLSDGGLENLQRCRGANCGLVVVMGNAVACTGMQGKSCEWRKKWFECLNGERLFPNGDSKCPFWHMYTGEQI